MINMVDDSNRSGHCSGINHTGDTHANLQKCRGFNAEDEVL